MATLRLGDEAPSFIAITADGEINYVDHVNAFDALTDQLAVFSHF